MYCFLFLSVGSCFMGVIFFYFACLLGVWVLALGF